MCLADNVLRSYQANGGHWKLIDFGLSKRLVDLNSTQSHLNTRTIQGMSSRSDIFCLFSSISSFTHVSDCVMMQVPMATSRESSKTPAT